MKTEKILIIGSNGQIGAELVLTLRSIYGSENVIASDVNEPSYEMKNGGPFELLNVLDKDRLRVIASRYRPSQIYILAALLSAKGEQNPKLAWDINMNGLLHVLDLAVELNVKVYWPSSIAVFGSNAPKTNTPQLCIMDPATIYGISKLSGELWCQYYYHKYALDVRSLRYPGVISWKSLPVGGTTDYAVHIFHAALKEGTYKCFLSENTGLPMMYMDDVIKATMTIMDADHASLSIRSSYNIAAFTVTPKELAKEIQKHIPGFTISYAPDFRQQIANSWPESINDEYARRDWGWNPDFDLAGMTELMLSNLRKSLHSKAHF